MYSNRLYTPLRYPGGKGAFAPFVIETMTRNNLSGHYLEPYAGGAGVALCLLQEGVTSHIHINDIDPAVHAFWVAATEHSDDLLRLLHDTPVTMEQWFQWRAVLRGEREASVVERGFATLFMNRTNRSGILKAGVIGGLNQSGPYKIDARFKKEVITSRIEKIAGYSSQITVYCEDALALIKRSADFLPARSLIYLDPPYFVKGKGLYRNFYKTDDHAQIATHLQSGELSSSWLVSYDNAPEILEMYSRSRKAQYSLNYSAQKIYRANEAVFFSSDLVVPEALAAQ